MSDSPATDVEVNGEHTTSSTPTRISRRDYLAGAAGLATASVGGCLSNPSPSEVREVSYRHRYERAGLSSAVNDGGIELGTWSSENLDVTFRESSGSQATVQSVQQGEDEFGNASTAAILQAIEKGASLTMFGHVLEPMDGVVALADANITTWSDLEGATVGVFPWSFQGKLAKIAMERNGADPEAVNFQNVSPGSHNTLLMQGELDANISYWPQSKIRLENQGYSVNTLDIGAELNHLGVCLFTRDEIIENEPDLVNRFTRGWLTAHQKFVTSIDAVIDAHEAKVEDFNEELERQTLPYIYAARVPGKDVGQSHGKGWISERKLENSLEILSDIGRLGESLELDDVFRNQFIEKNQNLAVNTAELYYEELAGSETVSV